MPKNVHFQAAKSSTQTNSSDSQTQTVIAYLRNKSSAIAKNWPRNVGMA